MRLSRLFSQTLREAPADSEVASHQLLVRAGFIRQLGAGIFTSLPLAQKSIQKITAIMREEINAIGGQEISMPVVQPADVWKETGRWYQIGSEMGRFVDRAGHDMVLAMTHEEVVADLVRGIVRSYRQLPALIYHIQTKWRDDPRPRAGLIRVREFTMLDSYSLDRDNAGLDAQYQAHFDAYFRIYQRCGLPVVAVQSDTGMMGGKMAHEYMYLTPIGEDSLLFCSNCGYSANRQVARTRKPVPTVESMLPVEKVPTPHASTIDELAAFLSIPASRTAKAVFLMATIENDRGEEENSLVFAVVRGDFEVNETKLANLLHAKELRPAVEEEIRAVGAVPGYASPVGLNGARVIVDELVPLSANLVAGANEEGFHLRHVNFGRDFTAETVADITSANEGDACPNCGHPMRLSRGVEVGNIFKLGTRYSDALGCTYLDENGSSLPVVMGSYGIGVGRLLACVAEEHHDERGLIWPVSIAPYPVHLVMLQGRMTDLVPVMDTLETELTACGLEPLVDDRAESAGVKFNDADLIGLPLRITLSERALKQGGVEFKLRGGGDSFIVPMEQAAERAGQILRELETLDPQTPTIKGTI
jgi:prolyl-tRNA synthetase